MGRLRDAILGSGVSLYVKFILLTAVLLTTFGVTSTLVNIREQQITATDRLL